MAAKRGTTRAMSDKHEKFLAELIGGRRTPGSGNGFANQMDVRNDSREDYALALDGKSTMSRSITVTLDMIEKGIEQAHECQAGFALRFYHDDRLNRSTDLILIDAGFFADLLYTARSSLRYEYETPRDPDD